MKNTQMPCRLFALLMNLNWLETALSSDSSYVFVSSITNMTNSLSTYLLNQPEYLLISSARNINAFNPSSSFNTLPP